MERKFSFWYDPWCNGYSIANIFPEINFRVPYVIKHAVVKDFWINGGWVVSTRWNPIMVRIHNFLNEHYVVNESKPD